VYIVAGLIVVVLLALVWRWESAGQRAERLAADAAEQRALEGDEEPPAAPFPTPPLDLPHYHGIGRASPGESVLAAVSTDDTKEV
jgi:NADH-quinone oxidoreductase subunit H